MAANLPLVTIEDGDADWAQKINQNFQIIKEHSHNFEDGTGIVISSNDVSFVSDVDSDDMDVNTLQFVSFDNLSETIISRNTLYVVDEELYYSNGTRFPIKITNNGSLNIKVIGGGGFSGGLSAAGASVTYTSASDTYQFLGNTASPCSINVNNVNVNNATIQSILSFSTMTLTDLVITNYSPQPNGNYVYFEGPVYNPQATLVPITTFAQTGALARSSILQTNFSPALVEKSYSTDIMTGTCRLYGIGSSPSTSFAFIQTPHSFMSDRNAYLTNRFLFTKSTSLFFSIYDRDGNNIPPTCFVPGTIPPVIRFDFNSSYNKNLFTPLVMASRRNT